MRSPPARPRRRNGIATNQFIYASNTYTTTIGTWTGNSMIYSASVSYTVPNLLTQVIGPDGNPVWSYGGFDTVVWANFFYDINNGVTNATTLTSAGFARYATNGLGQVAATVYSAGGGPVTFYELWPGTPSFPNSAYGTPLAAGYSGYNKILNATSIAGLTTTNIYNANGFLVQTIDLQIGRTNSFGYTTDGLIGTPTNELNLNLAATWDNLLRLTSVEFSDGTSISNVYNNLDLGGQRDRLANWTYYGYDGARHLTALTIQQCRHHVRLVRL